MDIATVIGIIAGFGLITVAIMIGGGAGIFVNVPSAVWIDEEGQIVRYNEGTYAAKHKMGTFEFGRDDYLLAVRDWIENGADSKYVQATSDVSKNIIARTPDAELAEPTFKLGVYFHLEGDETRANERAFDTCMPS